MSIDWSEKSNDELIELLANAGMDVPDGLPEAIIDRGESVVESLGEMLLDERNRVEGATEEQAWSRNHAFTLLGLIGSAKAAPALLDYYRTEIWDDALTEDGPQVLGRLGPEAIDPIIAYIGEEDRESTLRTVTMRSLVNIGYFHPEARERIAAFFKEALARADEEKDPEIPAGLVSAAACIDDQRVQNQIDSAFERGIVHPFHIRENDVRRIRTERPPWADHDPEKDLMYSFSREFFDSCRRAREREWTSKKKREARKHASSFDPNKPFNRQTPKIGRNDPCHCGSGNKYKKCCLDKDEAARRDDAAMIFPEEIDFSDDILSEDDGLIYDEYEMDDQDKRIAAILGSNDFRVGKKSLAKYRDYLKSNLSLPCRLTGIEDFLWEEFYVFGPGDEKEYEELKKTRPSYTDKFDFIDIDEHESLEEGLFVQVLRVSDNKRFALPLADLEPVDEDSENYQLLNDYSVWFVNSR